MYAWMAVEMDGCSGSCMVRGWMACVTAGLVTNWLDVWIFEKMRGSMYGWQDDCLIGRPDGFIAGWMARWMEDRLVERLNRLTDGYLTGWMDS